MYITIARPTRPYDAIFLEVSMLLYHYAIRSIFEFNNFKL